MAIHQRLICLLNQSHSEQAIGSMGRAPAQSQGRYSRDDDPAYDKLLQQHIPNDVVEDISNWDYRCRSIIPYILLSSLVAILCIAYLSFDLHPLACILEPEEELMTYEENSVELKFSFSLLIFQKVVAGIVIFLAIVFAISLGLFFWLTEKTIDNLQRYVEPKLNHYRNELGIRDVVQLQMTLNADSQC